MPPSIKSVESRNLHANVFPNTGEDWNLLPISSVSQYPPHIPPPCKQPEKAPPFIRGFHLPSTNICSSGSLALPPLTAARPNAPRATRDLTHAHGGSVNRAGANRTLPRPHRVPIQMHDAAQSGHTNSFQCDGWRLQLAWWYCNCKVACLLIEGTN